MIDDGRRFLERTATRYDVVIVDPPPPLETAGSNLLYTREFCELVRSRLKPTGIMQHWLPIPDPVVMCGLARAMQETFAHVRVFLSHEGWGFHFLASMAPIAAVGSDILTARLPPAALADMVEWEPGVTVHGRFETILKNEQPFAMTVSAGLPALEDDRPFNEYFFLRRSFGLMPR